MCPYELRVLASVEHHAGRLAAALHLSQAALALAGEIGARRIEADALNTLGGARLHLDCPARPPAITSRRSTSPVRPVLATPRSRHSLDCPRCTSASAPTARPWTAPSRHWPWPARPVIALLQGQAHTALAIAGLGLDRPQDAAAHARQALSIHVAGRHRLGEARALLTLGHAHKRSGTAGEAVASWRRALALFTELGSPEGEQVQALLHNAT